MSSRTQTYICSVDISKNAFNESVKKVLATMVHSTTTVSLDFSHNNIGDELFLDKAFLAKVLQSISASHNNLHGRIEFLETLRQADVSYNKITQFSGTFFSSANNLKQLDLRANPAFKLTEETFRLTDEIEVYEALDGSEERRLLCAKWTYSPEGTDRFLLPAHTVSYKGCRCAKGWGEPPECNSEPILVNSLDGSLPEKGKSVLGARGGLSAQWLIKPASATRAIYLKFTHFVVPTQGDIRVDVFLGNTRRGEARVLHYSQYTPPMIDSNPEKGWVLAGSSSATNGTVLINFETSLETTSFAFSNASDHGKTVSIKGSMVEVDGKERLVRWGQARHEDCVGKIKNIENGSNGQPGIVTLENSDTGEEETFENPLTPFIGFEYHAEDSCDGLYINGKHLRPFGYNLIASDKSTRECMAYVACILHACCIYVACMLHLCCVYVASVLHSCWDLLRVCCMCVAGPKTLKT